LATDFLDRFLADARWQSPGEDCDLRAKNWDSGLWVRGRVGEYDEAVGPGGGGSVVGEARGRARLMY